MRHLLAALRSLLSFAAQLAVIPSHARASKPIVVRRLRLLLEGCIAQPSRARALALSSLVVVLFAGIGVGKSSGSRSIATEQTSNPEAGIELIALRTEHSRTYLNPDGTKTAVLSSAPVNYKNVADAWQPIDSTLVPSSLTGYAWRNAANFFGLQFKSPLDEGFVLLQRGRSTYLFSLEGATAAPASIEGAEARYSGVLPNVDLVYTTLADGLKEALILANASVPLHYRFLLQAPADPDLRAEAQSDGSWLFFDGRSGTPVFLLQPPFAFETAPPAPGSSIPGHRRRTREPVSLDVTPVDGRLAIDVQIDAAWLQAPERSFPVVIDPTITVQPALDNEANWDFACPAAPNCYPDNSVEFSVGTEGPEIWRAGMKFDLGELPSGTSISSATLRTYFRTSCLDRSDDSDTCNVDHTINVHRMTSSFTSSTPTSQVSFDPAALSAFTMTAAAAQNEQWLSWNVTSAVQSWASGQQPNHGFMLKRATEPANAGGLELVGRWWKVPELRPRLEITFGDGVDLAAPATIASTGATLKWSQYAGAGFQRYEIHRSHSPRFTPSASTLLATITNLATTTYTDSTAIPSGSYTYEVVVNGTKPSNERTVLTPPTGQTMTIIQPAPAAGKSTYIFPRGGANGCLNYGGYEYMRTGTSDFSYFRVLLGFNLTGIPSTATIVNAKVGLHHPWYLGSATTIRAHRITSDWAEGSDVDPSACATVGASWINRLSSTVNWTTPGGDFDPAILASVSHAQSDAPSWDEWEIGGTVQKWIGGQAPNYGVLLKEANETVASGKWSVWYHSDDFLREPSLRPKLVVTWATDTSGGGLTLFTPDTVNPNGAVLKWSRYSGSAVFQKYEVHRSLTPNFTPTASTRLATITNVATTTYTDTSGVAEEMYTYKITGNSTWSNEQTVMLPPEGQVTKILQPDSAAGKSTVIYKNTDDPQKSICRNAGSDPDLFVGTGSTDLFRSLLSFDLATIPSAAAVLDAELSLWNVGETTAPPKVQVHALSRAWVEGSGRLDDFACSSGGASWANASAGVSWTTPGGDLDVDPWDSATSAGLATGAHWDSFDISALTERWVNGTQPNLGLALRTSDETLVEGRTVRYFSDDGSALVLRPKLAITYTMNNPEQDDQPLINAEPLPSETDTSPSTDPTDEPDVSIERGWGGDTGTLAGGAAAPTAGPFVVAIARGNDAIKFTNDDGEWTIYYNCVGPRPAMPGPPPIPARITSVGPGYVARFVDRHVTGVNPLTRANKRVVDGEQDAGPLNTDTGLRDKFNIFEAGGLGLFGMHYARGVAANTSAEADFTKFKIIEGQRCAQHNTGHGVYAARVLRPDGSICPAPKACSYADGPDRARMDIEVFFRDAEGETGQGPDDPGSPDLGPSGDAIVRVLYRWRIEPEIVRMFVSVTPLAKIASGSAVTSFVKEPKLVASVAGTRVVERTWVDPKTGRTVSRPPAYAYRRIVVFAGRDAKAQYPAHTRAGDATQMTVRTSHDAHPRRKRVRWDFSGDKFDKSQKCQDVNAACFSVLMKAFPPATIESGTVTGVGKVWFSGVAEGIGGQGLDAWAKYSATRRAAFSRDTKGDEIKCPPECPLPVGYPAGTWGCHKLPSASASNTNVFGVRRWEFVGRKPNATESAPWVSSAVLFHGWEGGRGPYDCEPLLREFPPPNTQRYGACATFDLNEGFSRQLDSLPTC